MGKGAGQPFPPALIQRAERPLHLTQGLAALRRRLRIHQIGDGLRFSKVELAVLEGTAGELTGFGDAQAGQGGQRLDHPGRHGAPAMQMQFHHILARETAGGSEIEDERAVQHFSRVRVAQGTQDRFTWLR